MVPNICLSERHTLHNLAFGTIANGPEHLFPNFRDHCQWSRTFVIKHSGLFGIVLTLIECKLDHFVIELGISILKGIWTKKS